MIDAFYFAEKVRLNVIIGDRCGLKKKRWVLGHLQIRMVIRAPGRVNSIPLCDVDENTKRRSPNGSAQLSARGEGRHKKVIEVGAAEKRLMSKAIAVGDFQLDIRPLATTGFKSYQLKVKEIIITQRAPPCPCISTSTCSMTTSP